MIPLFKTMDEAIDAAAEHIPNGFQIAIYIERHGYSVTLKNGTTHDEYELDGGDGMRSDVWEGIEKANQLKEQNQ